MKENTEYGIIGTTGVGTMASILLHTIHDTNQVVVSPPPFEPEPFIIKARPELECYVGDFKTGKERRRERRARERAEKKQEFRNRKRIKSKRDE